jgi:hypothetical protein
MFHKTEISMSIRARIHISQIYIITIYFNGRINISVTSVAKKNFALEI